MRRLVTVLAAVVLGASGTYVIVYLFRWEWHRALIAGLFFLATETAVIGTVLLRRLRILERRLAPAPAVHEAVVLDLLRDSAPPPPERFAWLSGDPGRLGVFLPILLGAGALASAVAWAVEWAARATARPALERGLAVRLGTLSLPDEGLLGPDPAPRRRPRHGRGWDRGPNLEDGQAWWGAKRPVLHRKGPTHWRSRGAGAPAGKRTEGRGAGDPAGKGKARWAAWAVVVAAVAATSAVGVDALADATQSRPDHVRPGWETTVELQLYGGGAAEAAGNDLWAACRHLLGRRAAGARIDHLGAGRMRIALPSHLGAHAADRLHGCLEDAIVDSVQARVLAISAAPSVRPAGVPRGGEVHPAPG